MIAAGDASVDLTNDDDNNNYDNYDNYDIGILLQHTLRALTGDYVRINCSQWISGRPAECVVSQWVA